MKNFTICTKFLWAHVFAFIALFETAPLAAQSFPCGSQLLSVCNCDGPGILIADSEPCDFNTATETYGFVLVDINNATVGGDSDDGLIDQFNQSGTFANVATGDYAMYYISYDQDAISDIFPLLSSGSSIDDLLALGTEGPPGTWTSSDPAFTVVATPLATVNGPECACTAYSVGNYIWQDANNNGVQDSNEVGLPGVTVNLYDADGNLVATTTTNGNGYYGFENVPAGDYYVEVDLGSIPTGYSVSPPGQGNESTDSDLNADGQSDIFTVSAGSSDTSVDGGFFSEEAGTFLASELTPFEGKALSSGNELNWITSAEVENDYFTIERSTDGVEFSPIGTIKGAGDSNISKYYIFLDQDAPNGTSYYKLKNTSYAGTTKVVSNTVSVTRELTGLSITNLYPVPTNDVINIEFNSLTSVDTNVKIFSLSGSLIVENNISAKKGVNTLVVDVVDYPIGVYFITIESDNHKIVGKFIKSEK